MVIKKSKSTEIMKVNHVYYSVSLVAFLEGAQLIKDSNLNLRTLFSEFDLGRIEKQTIYSFNFCL